MIELFSLLLFLSLILSLSFYYGEFFFLLHCMCDYRRVIISKIVFNIEWYPFTLLFSLILHWIKKFIRHDDRKWEDGAW